MKIPILTHCPSLWPQWSHLSLHWWSSWLSWRQGAETQWIHSLEKEFVVGSSLAQNWAWKLPEPEAALRSSNYACSASYGPQVILAHGISASFHSSALSPFSYWYPKSKSQKREMIIGLIFTNTTLGRAFHMRHHHSIREGPVLF